MHVRLGMAVTGTALAAGLLASVGATASPTSAKRPLCLGAPATIAGTAKSDVLRGTRTRDVIVAGKGADRVYGRGGSDLLCGGPGDDLLDGGSGRNRLDGGPGRDQCLRVSRPIGCEPPRQPGPPGDPAPMRDPAPPIEGVTIDGERVSLADFRGRAVFVNVWASW
jgi:RTX calcium-binding nonapeptide repeat (4 copies)